jgi:hypothetical protein
VKGVEFELELGVGVLARVQQEHTVLSTESRLHYPVASQGLKPL